MSYTIKLEGLSFYAFHGVYDYERQAGNTFLVDVEVEFPLSRLPQVDDMAETPDYQLLHTIVKEEMSIPCQLLETLARHMTSRLWDSFAEVRQVKIQLRKLNPPIGNVCASSSVVLVTQQPLK
jgi:7,8-dihydroneopterin aldolase/epimerase/oxygenase